MLGREDRNEEGDLLWKPTGIGPPESMHVWARHTHGYFMAAVALGEAIDAAEKKDRTSSFGDADESVFADDMVRPFLFTLRHGVEVLLKMLAIAGKFGGENVSCKSGHKLIATLWPHAEKTLEVFNGREHIKPLKQLVDLFDLIDSSGAELRYPAKNGLNKLSDSYAADWIRDGGQLNLTFITTLAREISPLVFMPYVVDEILDAKAIEAEMEAEALADMESYW